MEPAQLTAELKDAARRLGFELSGACAATAPPRLAAFQQWLADGFAGQMRYLPDRAAACEHPRSILEGVRSLLVLGMNYRTVEPRPVGPGQAAVARYAWGQDYHDLIHQRLARLIEVHRRLAPGAGVRGVVDTAPLLEREFAQLAGLGWIGKNTLLLNRRQGSWLFLASLLTSEVLCYDEPFTTDHCGSCRACLDACPTGALVDAYRLDARRCISYLTIEVKGPTPEADRPLHDGWLFGCDICQEVCPWNRKPLPTEEPAFQPLADRHPAELAELFWLDEAEFRRRYRGSPLARPKRAGLLRNAALALGNRPYPPALPALRHGLNDPDPAVRDACAWAVARYEGG